MTDRRFRFGYVLGDTGLIDDEAENKWFIENCCNISDLKKNWIIVCEKLNELHEENLQLIEENQRLTEKLNQTALELVDECISQEKAVEISEMRYNEFLKYRARHGKPMELYL